MQPSQLGARYERMLDSLPGSEPDILSAARSMELDGQADRACKLLEEASKRHPSPNLCKTLAALHLKQRRFSDCALAIAKVVDQNPADIPSHLLLAEALIEGGEHVHALRTLARAEELGASKLRLFKLERRVDAEVREAFEEQRANEARGSEAPPSEGPPTGPIPALEAKTDPDGSPGDSTTEPEAFAGGIAPAATSEPPGAGTDPATDSSVFEDGSFSNLSSFELAEGAAQLEDGAASNIFDTLVDGHGGDEADLSFDALLVDLGVPVDAAPDDPESTGSLPRVNQDKVASQWGLTEEAQAAGPDDQTGAIDRDRLAELEGFERRQRAQPPAGPSSSTEERASMDAADELDDADFEAKATEVRPATQRRGAAQVGPSHPGPSDQASRPQRTKPARPSVQPSRSDGAAPANPAPPAPSGETGGEPGNDRRPLPPSVREQRQARRRPTGQSAAIERPGGRRREERAGEHARGNEPRARTAHDKKHQTESCSPGPRIFGQSPWLIAAATGGVVLLALIAVVAWASDSVSSAVEQPLLAARDASSADTYRGYLDAEIALARALDAESFLGATVDQTLTDLGLMQAAEEARVEAAAQRAMLAAMIEYRYEHTNARNAERHITAAELASPDDPRVELARAYQLMTRLRLDEAIARLEATTKEFPDFHAATATLVLAQMEAGRLKAASQTAQTLRELDKPSVSHHYVLASLDARLGRPDADGRFRHIIESISPSHISARIERTKTVRRDDDSEQSLAKARRLIDEILGPMREHSSPMQRAQAYIARGDHHLAEGAHARAEEHYRKAIKAVPSRTKVYTPLIDLYTADGRLERAMQLVEEAASRGATSPQLVFQRARLLRLTGQADRALRALDDQEPQSAPSLWLQGVLHLELGDRKKAGEAFEAAVSKRGEFVRARAWKHLVEEFHSTDERSGIDAAFAELLDEAGGDPEVLRAGALACMRHARSSDSSAGRDELLERADTLLERALSAGANEAVLRYDLCRQRMLRGDAEDASVYCGKARRANELYLPGLLLTADLEIRRGEYDAALELLVKADDRFDDEPSISPLKALAHIRRYELEAAETTINRWAATEAAKAPMHLLAEGELAVARDRDTSALGYFKRAHEKAPDDARIAVHYAHTLTRLGEHERAEELVRAHLSDLEWGPVAWLVFGELRRRQGRFPDAKENIEVALRKFNEVITPPWRISQAHTQLAHAWADRYGWSYRWVGRHLYRGADRGDASYPPLNAARGTYYLEQRRPNRSKAARAFEKVIEKQPFNCSVLQTLRTLYDEMDADERPSADTGRTDALFSEHCKD